MEYSVFGKRFLITDNLTLFERVVAGVSELCATGIFLFVGCAGCLSLFLKPSHIEICLTFGLGAMISIQCFGHLSGSHINPLVSVAAFTLGNISLIQLPVYCIGQILGAFLGFGLIRVITPAKYFFVKNVTTPYGLCSPYLHPDVEVYQGAMLEFFISLMLTLVCCAVWDIRNANNLDSVSVRFGLAITVLAIIGGPYSGGNMNPARSLAPALINGDIEEHHWIYWIPALLAGFLGALGYRFLFGKEPVDEHKEGNE